MAQVQNLAQVRNSLHHHQSFTDKLVEDALFTSPTSPLHSPTVNQLLRRAASAHRRERRISSDPDSEHKRSRAEHIIGNNNNNNIELPQHQLPPQVAPTDFSPSAMKNQLNNGNSKADIEGNGISSTERDSKSPSPTSNRIGKFFINFHTHYFNKGSNKKFDFMRKKEMNLNIFFLCLKFFYSIDSRLC